MGQSPAKAQATLKWSLLALIGILVVSMAWEVLVGTGLRPGWAVLNVIAIVGLSFGLFQNRKKK